MRVGAGVDAGMRLTRAIFHDSCALRARGPGWSTGETLRAIPLETWADETRDSGHNFKEEGLLCIRFLHICDFFIFLFFMVGCVGCWCVPKLNFVGWV